MDSNQIQFIADAMDTHSNRTFATELTELANIISTNAHSLANLPVATTDAEFDARQSLRDAGHTARMRQLAIISEMMERTLASPAPPPPVVCGKCHGPIEHPFEFRGVNYCCDQCRHDAGDYRHCRRDVCGCTGFAIKRRQLREHREQMRLMWQVIMACGFEDEVERAMEEDGWPERVWDDAEMDERSDAEDPMVTQANELSNIDSIVQLSRNMVELAGVRRDLKRARDGD
jgi:hypothetical protein